MAKAVSFDLWFTLVWEKVPEDVELYTNLRISSIERTLKARGYEVPKELILRVYRGLGNSRMVLSVRELASIITAALGLRDPKLVEEIARAYETSTDDFTPRLNEEAAEVLPKLKRAGLKIAVVSNTSFTARSVRRFLDNLGLGEYVDYVISSSDVGLAKPQRAIFVKLLEHLGYNGSDVVHVGDSCVDDVLGALSSGLRAVYYVGLLELRNAEVDELCSRLVPTLRSLHDLPRVLNSL
jgi:putative hydrolase of the HAD superfamily